jgi:beta-lactamase class D
MKVLYRLLFAVCCVVSLYSCSSNNVHQRKDWDKYFTGNGISGCFMLHNTVLNTYEVYNLKGTQDRYMPAATFDIMNSLAGLETGIISDTNMVIRDSLNQPVKGVDPDMTLGKAFRSSYLPYFREVARRIGKAKMQFWLDSVKYGNTLIRAGMDTFWLDNTLAISPDEQMGLLQLLYYGKLPFQSRTQRLVRDLMLMKKTAGYRLSYVSGTGPAAGKQVGWIVGWIEEKEHPYFFVLNMETPDSLKDIKALGFTILRHILDGEGYFKKNR